MVALFLDDDKTNDDGDGKEIGKKWYAYINKQQLCTCITLFCTFFAVIALVWHETNFTSPFYGVGEHNTKIVSFIL